MIRRRRFPSPRSSHLHRRSSLRHQPSHRPLVNHLRRPNLRFLARHPNTPHRDLHSNIRTNHRHLNRDNHPNPVRLHNSINSKDDNDSLGLRDHNLPPRAHLVSHSVLFISAPIGVARYHSNHHRLEHPSRAVPNPHDPRLANLRNRDDRNDRIRGERESHHRGNGHPRANVLPRAPCPKCSGRVFEAGFPWLQDQ
jgi:hypothetical protein